MRRRESLSPRLFSLHGRPSAHCELIENLLALKDVVLIEESCSLEEEKDFV